MRLTKQTGHAIRILIDCARSDGALIKVADIAQHLDISPQNVFKIVHILSRAGFLSSTRGPTGGVKLKTNAAAIRIGEIVRAIEETELAIDRNRVRTERSAASDSAVNAVFSDALEAFISVLDAHTLADLARTHRGEHADKGKRRPSPKKPMLKRTG